MPALDWHECRFLESTENLKPLVKRLVGREPSSTIAREIASCLQQGRLFYEAAIASPLEIRPLQLFYGMVAFSKAMVVAKKLCSLSTLKPAHGLKDISQGALRIADLRLRIESAGNFQDFNDVVYDRSRLCYLDSLGKTQAVTVPSSKSDDLPGVVLSLREILGRVPGLDFLYRLTFGESAGASPMTLKVGLSNLDFQISLEDDRLFEDRNSLASMVEGWRYTFPFLRIWRLQTAYHGYGKSHLTFQNCSPPADEVACLIQRTTGLFEQVQPLDGRFSLEQGLESVADSFVGPVYAMSPVNGRGCSELALHYLGLYLLSSLVRYRPQTWMHALSRSVTSDAPADDKMLSLIERFLNVNTMIVPAMVTTFLNPHAGF